MKFIIRKRGKGDREERDAFQQATCQMARESRAGLCKRYQWHNSQESPKGIREQGLSKGKYGRKSRRIQEKY